jgi:thymidylate synthase
VYNDAQFHLSEKQLHLSVTLRSNDAYWGLPHDVFSFTMIQEMMARRLERSRQVW